MKNYILVVLFFLNVNAFAQKDPVINYLSSKRKKVDVKKAVYYEVLTQQRDSLWLSNVYIKNNRKKIATSFYKTKHKKTKVGKTTFYNLKGEVSWIRYYDEEGKKLGTSTRWFDNGNVNLVGAYENGKQEGSWKFYHTNGKLAAEKIYDKGALKKEFFYNEKGKELAYGSFINRKEEAVFKGGKEKYYEKIKGVRMKLLQFIKKEKIAYKFTSNLTVRYVIGVDGKIRDVTVDEFIPKKINDFLVKSFEKINGWKPRVYLNRKVPKYFIQRLKFRV